jgi:hypothetical protein
MKMMLAPVKYYLLLSTGSAHTIQCVIIIFNMQGIHNIVKLDNLILNHHLRSDFVSRQVCGLSVIS